MHAGQDASALDTQALVFEIDPHAPRPRGAEAPKAFVGKTEVVRSSSCPHFTTFVDVSLRHTTNVLKQQQLVVAIVRAQTVQQHRVSLLVVVQRRVVVRTTSTTAM